MGCSHTQLASHFWYSFTKKQVILSPGQNSICRLFSLVLLLLIKRSELRTRWNRTGTCKSFVFSLSQSLLLYLPPSHLCSCFLSSPSCTLWPFTTPFADPKSNVSSHWTAFQNLLSLYGFHIYFPNQSLKWNDLYPKWHSVQHARLTVLRLYLQREWYRRLKRSHLKCAFSVVITVGQKECFMVKRFPTSPNHSVGHVPVCKADPLSKSASTTVLGFFRNIF